jgi:membrane associated rhomboid family serine protease
MVKKNIIIGTVLGFVGGILFSIFYFGETQLTTPMAYVHEVSGALLGMLIGWIVGLSKSRKQGN